MRQRLATAMLAAMTAAHGASAQQIVDTAQLEIRGVSEERRDELLERLEAGSATVQILEEARTAADDPDATPVTVQDVFGVALSDYRNLVGLLFDAGYYGPEISIRVNGREAAEIDPFRIPADIDSVEIRIDPGPRFRFGQAEVAPRAPGAEADPIVPGFARGETARASVVGNAANAGVREWRREGHATATVDGQTVIADHPARELDVSVRLAPGPQLRFGRLTIDNRANPQGGQVSRRRIEQIMGFPQGEVFSPDALRVAVDRVRRTGVWRTVTVQQAETPNADGTLDYSMTLIEEQPRRFGVSAEYSTVDGLGLSGFWLHRNLFGGAERLRISGTAENIGSDAVGFGDDRGGEDYSASIRLTRPGTFGPDNDAFLFGDVAVENEPDYDETSVTFGLGVKRYFTRNFYAQVAGGLRYSDVDDTFGERQFYHAVFPSELEWDRRDDPGDPSRGFYVFWDLEPFVALDGDSQTGVFSDLDTRAYFSIGGDRRTTFAARAQIGNVAFSDLDATPPDYLFFSGGGDTVRGHGYQSLGITQPNGRDSGGRSFLGLSGEIRQDITDAIGAVAFVDVGYISAEEIIDTDAESHTGVGVGVRYGTPIGPVRVDIATPYSDEDDRWRAYELYIGVGQAF